MELALQLIEKAKQERALHLDLGNCGLEELPDELFELTWLESLVLGDTFFNLEIGVRQGTKNQGQPNQITALTAQIAQFSALRQLSIGRRYYRNNEVYGVGNLSECQSLTHLSLWGYPASDTSALKNLMGLQVLNLSSPQISDISALKNLTGLQELDISSSQISDISALKNLTGLQVLNLSGPQISDISALKNLTGLQELDISDTQISDISALKNLTGLQKLDISNTQISDISALKNLTGLQVLNLSSTQISDISALKNLTGLQMLGISSNQISDISALKNLTGLQKLVIPNTQISDIADLENLAELQKLYLSNTQISDISALKNLTKLQELDLQGTQVSDITPLLPLLKKPITVMSDQLAIFHGQFINLYKTPVPNIVYDLLGDKNNEKLINYLEQITQPDNPPQKLYEAKLMVVGEPGAGKTSLMNKLLDPNYVLPEPCDADSTTGANIEPWSFKTPDGNQVFQAHIWDFGGQKRQYMTHQFFLTAHTVYILVDTNDRKEQDNFPYWFKIINLLGRDNTSNQCSPLRIFLNEREHKQDAPVFSFTFDSKLYEQQYPDLPFDNKRFNLNDPVELQAFTHKIQQSLLQLHHIGDPVPTQWISVRQQLSQLAKTRPHISLKEFQNLCCEYGINNEGYQEVFSYRLHTLGSILHFQEDDVLRELIIINPNWAVDAVYSVLKDGEIEKNGGYFSRKNLQQIWGDTYSASEQAHLLRLMSYEAFEICYQIERPENDGEWYLAPQFLAEKSVDYTLESEQTPLKFRFSYTFMPEGIVARLVVRLHEGILTEDDKPLAWKTGFILQDNGAQLRVQEREQGGLKILDMEAGGRPDEQKYIIRKVRDEVNRIHRRWFKGIQASEMVPCSCSECKDSSTPHYFKNEVLQLRLQKDKTHIDCDKSIESIAIRGLLEGIYQQDELPSLDADTTHGQSPSGVVNNISVAEGAQLVMPQGGSSQPTIQANGHAQASINEQPDSSTTAPTPPDPVGSLMSEQPKKAFYQEWWVISLALGIVAGGSVGLWASSFWLGLIASIIAFAAVMFFKPGKTYVRAAGVCLMAVISAPLISGMIGQNPELIDGKFGFVFKLNESLPTPVLVTLLVLAGGLFVLDYLKNRRS